MLIYQNNPPPSCQQRQSFLSLTTKYLLQATSPLSLPSSHCSDWGEAQNETPKSVRCTHLKTILLFSMVDTFHGQSLIRLFFCPKTTQIHSTKMPRKWVLAFWKWVSALWKWVFGFWKWVFASRKWVLTFFWMSFGILEQSLGLFE